MCAAERAWSEDLGMLTSYLQLSGAGLNSLPLAVTFPTSPSDGCVGLHSVPDKLLKILTPAGGQSCGSLAREGALLPLHCEHMPTQLIPCLVYLVTPHASTPCTESLKGD